MLAAAVLGYLAGAALPPRAQRLAHPIMLAADAPNLAAAALGAATGAGYWATLATYLTRGAGGAPRGGGDALFAFLGPIILCFAFKVFERWDALRRNAAALLGGAAAAAAFTLLSTAALARLAGLPPPLARGLVPRGATLALALPIAARLGAQPDVTAAAVSLTALFGAAGVLPLLDAFGFADPLTRGLTAAVTAHGLGAAVAAREPAALPFAALSYALCGISATLLASVPPFAALLLRCTG
jgi:putative effector of murein hydrolase